MYQCKFASNKRVYWEHRKFYCHDVSFLSLLVTICKNVVVHVVQVSCACSSCGMSDLIFKPDLNLEILFRGQYLKGFTGGF